VWSPFREVRSQKSAAAKTALKSRASLAPTSHHDRVSMAGEYPFGYRRRQMGARLMDHATIFDEGEETHDNSDVPKRHPAIPKRHPPITHKHPRPRLRRSGTRDSVQAAWRAKKKVARALLSP
jgi:hypothetical protein